jgi:hypothetical protein
MLGRTALGPLGCGGEGGLADADGRCAGAACSVANPVYSMRPAHKPPGKAQHKAFQTRPTEASLKQGLPMLAHRWPARPAARPPSLGRRSAPRGSAPRRPRPPRPRASAPGGRRPGRVAPPMPIPTPSVAVAVAVAGSTPRAGRCTCPPGTAGTRPPAGRAAWGESRDPPAAARCRPAACRGGRCSAPP